MLELIYFHFIRLPFPVYQAILLNYEVFFFEVYLYIFMLLLHLLALNEIFLFVVIKGKRNIPHSLSTLPTVFLSYFIFTFSEVLVLLFWSVSTISLFIIQLNAFNTHQCFICGYIILAD